MIAACEDSAGPSIEVSALSYAYPEGEDVLSDVSFDVAAGETVVLVGLSGCGKTTLCHCLSGLAPKALGGTLRGTVRIMGRDVAPVPLARLACEVGVVFQDSDNQMVTTAVEDEVAFAPENLALDPREIRRRVDRELERFGVCGLALRSPNSLSGGEKRLVAIASVLALDPPIVDHDKPLWHLDETGRGSVRDAMLGLRQEGRTLVIVEHDLSRTEFADRYLLIDGGRLVGSTTTPPPEFVDSPVGDRPPADPTPT